VLTSACTTSRSPESHRDVSLRAAEQPAEPRGRTGSTRATGHDQVSSNVQFSSDAERGDPRFREIVPGTGRPNAAANLHGEHESVATKEGRDAGRGLLEHKVIYC
jgi:hypothetical protein